MNRIVHLLRFTLLLQIPVQNPLTPPQRTRVQQILRINIPHTSQLQHVLRGRLKPNLLLVLPIPQPHHRRRQLILPTPPLQHPPNLPPPNPNHQLVQLPINRPLPPRQIVQKVILHKAIKQHPLPRQPHPHQLKFPQRLHLLRRLEPQPHINPVLHRQAVLVLGPVQVGPARKPIKQSERPRRIQFQLAHFHARSRIHRELQRPAHVRVNVAQLVHRVGFVDVQIQDVLLVAGKVDREVLQQAQFAAAVLLGPF
uniref:(northern house mosquito) hypothetical protein n=1 Tax=Culex pipiens TaxID=7175 RepID=A0A8D8KLA2_CULPI